MANGKAYAMKTSTLLISLGGILSATTLKWPWNWDRRTIAEIYRDSKAGKLQMSLYAKLISPISFALIIFGMYLALTWR